MKIFKNIKRALLFPLIGILFATSALSYTAPVYAEPASNQTTTTNSDETAPTTVPGDPNANEESNSETTSDSKTENKTEEDDGDSTSSCYSQIGGMGWAICPILSIVAKGVDTLYGIVEDFLVINPISTDENSPILTIWLYARNITNIIFIIFLLVIIYSQLTGFGFNNYNLKKMLPRLVISAILVNLSFIITVACVDVSNIVGHSIHDFLTSVSTQYAETVTANNPSATVNVDFYTVFATIAAGGVIGKIAIGLTGGPLGLLLTLIPIIFGALISVVIGLICISLRQAVVILLVAVAPLAFVAYMMPNTEKWYKKWIQTLSQMLFFYPMFSLLFGASKIASTIFISSADSMLSLILGLAVQVMPLIFALGLMKMAGTVLGGVSSALGRLGDKANAGVKNYAESRKELAKQKQLTRGMRQPFNAFSVASWRAYAQKRQDRIDHLLEQQKGINDGLRKENMNALRRNKRIIGYGKDNQPIYTQLPYKRSNKYMNAEAEAREVNLRLQADNLKTDNVYAELSDFLKENKIKGRATINASKMGHHWLDLYTQTMAKQMNDESDMQFAVKNIMKAAERDDNGNIIDAEKYKKYVIGALGATGYNVRRNADEEGRRLALQAEVSVVGDAYARDAAQRSKTISRFESYMDKQNTKEVIRQYNALIDDKSIDGMVAAHHILARRGDYDKIAKGLDRYMKEGIKLGTDEASTLALSLNEMKNESPIFGGLAKAINVETWAYTDGKRRQNFTLKEFLTGKNDDGYTCKYDLAKTMEGRSWDKIDRTAFDAFDQIVNSAISEGQIDEATAKNCLRRTYDAMKPQLISAIPKFASGSEQIKAASKFVTGAKKENGNWVLDDKVDPAYADLKHEFMKNMLGAFNGANILTMKSDFWESVKGRESIEQNGDSDLAIDTLKGFFNQEALKKAATSYNIGSSKERLAEDLNFNEIREQAEEEKEQKAERARMKVRNQNQP